MNYALLSKCVTEARLLLAGLGTTLFAVCWLSVFIVSRLQTSQFAAIIEQVWDQVKDLWPVPLDQLISYTGRLAVVYNEPVIVFGVSLFAVARGSDVVSGELGRGTLEMLLAQPVSRLQVLYTQAVVTVAGLVLLCFATWAGTTAGIYTTSVKEDLPPPSLRLPGLGVSVPLSLRKSETITVPMSERTKASYFVAGSFNLFCLTFAVAGLSTVVSSLDRYRWRTIGIVVSFYVISIVLKLLGQAIDEISWLQYLSIFTAYEPQKFISMAVHQPELVWSIGWDEAASSHRPAELGALGNNVILLAFGAICYLAAGIAFHKRNLPAPL